MAEPTATPPKRPAPQASGQPPLKIVKDGKRPESSGAEITGAEGARGNCSGAGGAEGRGAEGSRAQGAGGGFCSGASAANFSWPAVSQISSLSVLPST